MNPYLVIAAVLLTLISVNHSIGAERFILAPVLRAPNVPGLIGELGRSVLVSEPAFMRRVLRTSWHVTIVPWIGSAVLLYGFARGGVDATAREVIVALSIVYALTAAIICACTRARHCSWIIFAVIALCRWRGATSDGSCAPNARLPSCRLLIDVPLSPRGCAYERLAHLAVCAPAHAAINQAPFGACCHT